jgi:hypothetical protein
MIIELFHAKNAGLLKEECARVELTVQCLIRLDLQIKNMAYVVSLESHLIFVVKPMIGVNYLHAALL